MKLVNSKKDVLTIPNVLSLFRFILAGVFLWMYYAAEIENKRYWLTGVLLLSAVTDFLDGKIARRWNMVSEIGKILYPIAVSYTHLQREGGCRIFKPGYHEERSGSDHVRKP